MKVSAALVSLNPTVGALDANLEAIVAAYLAETAKGADIVITPEMSLAGYPLEDLTQKPCFLAAVERARAELHRRIVETGRTAALVYGHPTDTGRHDGNRRLVYNSVTFFDPKTGAADVVHKQELPNYGVFDEKRNYVEGPTSGDGTGTIRWRGLRLGILVCEDGWFPRVTSRLAAQGADLLIWVNGSPYAENKNVLRRAHAADRIAQARVPIAYVNLAGGQDELVFDGDCFAWDGEHYQQGRLFAPSSFVFEFDVVRGQAVKRPLERRMMDVTPFGIAQSYCAIVAGVRDYLGKARFGRVVLGYSGGVDSGLVAAIAADALGPENVLLVRLPSKFSSDGSLDDAFEGAARLGCELRTIAIEPAVEAMRELYGSMLFDNRDQPSDTPVLTGVSDENIQARVRGNILMAISNQEGMMVLNTTNWTEAMTGYGTLHGDMTGGYSPLKDVPKTGVWTMCRWRNAQSRERLDLFGLLGPVADVVPDEIIDKPPSAELRPDQKDTDSLLPYPVLDPILKALVVEERPVEDVAALGLASLEEIRDVERRVFANEYKRRLAAPGVKISTQLLGRDRRYPIINGFRSA